MDELPMLRYMDVLVLWIVLPMTKYSEEATGPITGVDSGV